MRRDDLNLILSYIFECLDMMLLALLCVLGVMLGGVEPHGRLILPAARNCMWRFGFPNPKNYDDAGLYCGGFNRQWHKNKGTTVVFIRIYTFFLKI